MINVIFAVNETTWGLLKQNFKRDEDGNRLRTDLTDSQARKLKENVSGHWKIPSIGGTVYHVVSWYVPEIYADKEVGMESGLKWVEFLLNEFPSKFHIIGAWDKTGAQFGTTITQVENGIDVIPVQREVTAMEDVQVIDIEATQLSGEVVYKTEQVEVVVGYEPTGEFIDVPHYDEVIEGTPVYPIHAQYMKIFPDDVEYDENDNEISRTPASAPKEVNTNFGCNFRRWN